MIFFDYFAIEIKPAVAIVATLPAFFHVNELSRVLCLPTEHSTAIFEQCVQVHKHKQFQMGLSLLGVDLARAAFNPTDFSVRKGNYLILGKQWLFPFSFTGGAFMITPNFVFVFLSLAFV